MAGDGSEYLPDVGKVLLHEGLEMEQQLLPQGRNKNIGDKHGFTSGKIFSSLNIIKHKFRPIFLLFNYEDFK